MAPKSRADRLFGAACLWVALEASTQPAQSDIMLGALRDLNLDVKDVEAYLRDHRAEVVEALQRGRHGG